MEKMKELWRHLVYLKSIEEYNKVVYAPPIPREEEQ